MLSASYSGFDPVRALGESDSLDDRRHKPRRRELLNQVVRLLFRNISAGEAPLIRLDCSVAIPN
jgi:hypothetical protein